MAGFDDIAKKAQQFLGNDKVKDALKSEKAEGTSDKLLDAVAGAADKATGGKYTDKIDKARDEADKRVGNE
ncbi:antitoxin protein of toxin-antitoxin system [Frondihabitans sp. PhB188]|uniref:antitoxin n=1 Tax=Frondihabitans sp. PhB188 TaxID=2485200 RepID=UPI000F472DE5|nr:antitoxin [Frondihabitans sp. PhB188]ROQ40017.1 antitoxin protein of toxin-antitoxin system [Frondihabitans sp. PhB188]